MIVSNICENKVHVPVTTNQSTISCPAATTFYASSCFLRPWHWDLRGRGQAHLHRIVQWCGWIEDDTWAEKSGSPVSACETRGLTTGSFFLGQKKEKRNVETGLRDMSELQVIT